MSRAKKTTAPEPTSGDSENTSTPAGEPSPSPAAAADSGGVWPPSAAPRMREPEHLEGHLSRVDPRKVKELRAKLKAAKGG